MRRGFTLIEVMISIVLLSLIVTFLYQSLAQLQSSNQSLLKRSQSVEVRESLLKLLYNDFINAEAVSWQEKKPQSDTIVLHTVNSLHEMSQPYVTYKLFKEENTLRRIERPIEQTDFTDKVFRFDDLIKGCKTFKLYAHEGHYLLYLKAEGIEDIYLDLLPPVLQNPMPVQKPNDEDTTVSDKNVTAKPQEGGEI